MVDATRELARRMLADYDARTPGQLFGEPLDLTTVQAYALQAEIARLREERGEKVIGYKVGCTSRAIQVQLGVKEPIFGRLFDTECHPSGVHLSSARYANLAVEGEMAVRLSKDLPGEPLSAEECRRGHRRGVSGDRVAPLCPSRGLASWSVVDREQRHARGIRACGGGVTLLWLGELRAQP